MAISKTPTTTATIQINSNNISSNPVNLSCSWAMYKEGSRSVGLDITSGLNRMNLGTQTIAVIGTAAQYNSDEGGMMYIKNLSTTAGEHLLITIGSVVGRLQPGAACLIPWGGNTDFSVTQGVADMEWEYQLFIEKN
tara:strand:+ start:801 stop:1211 length:411 start_codon:yes stop_codon:yes gene_type:complete